MSSDFKAMFDIGARVYEIRIHVAGEWRVVYIAKKADAVYVLHVFQKKTRKTRRADLNLIGHRYRQLGH